MIVSQHNGIAGVLSSHLSFINFLRLSTDVFDVVRDTKDRVYLLDFSPFGEKWSDSLAFEWDDLLKIVIFSIDFAMRN